MIYTKSFRGAERERRSKITRKGNGLCFQLDSDRGAWGKEKRDLCDEDDG